MAGAKKHKTLGNTITAQKHDNAELSQRSQYSSKSVTLFHVLPYLFSHSSKTTGKKLMLEIKTF